MITRRELLKFVGAGAALAALPGRALSDSTQAQAEVLPPNSPIYRFGVGDFACASLAVGLWDVPLPSPQPLFHPRANPEAFKAAMEDEHLPTDKVRLYFNVLLVRTGRENILIDAGFGGPRPAPFDLLASLAQLGLKAEDISAVFLSHAHSDHMGGLLSAEGKPIFTRAEHFCSQEEHAFWTGAKPDFSTSRSETKSLQGMVEGARKTFEGVRFTLLKNGVKTPEGIEALLSPGHTPGHLTFRLRSKTETLYHISDLAHHYAVMLPHPDWSIVFDVNESQAVATRREVFARLAQERTAVFGYHLPHPGLGSLRAQGEGYRWLPRGWDTGV